MKIIFILFSFLGFTLPVFASSLHVDMAPIPWNVYRDSSGGLSSAANVLEVFFRVNCAGRNLRSTANPLARDGVLIPKVEVSVPGRVYSFTYTHIPTTFEQIATGIANKTLINNFINLPLATPVEAINIPLTCTGVACAAPVAGRNVADAYRGIDSRAGLIRMRLGLNADDIQDFWSTTTDTYIEHPTVNVSFEQRLSRPGGGEYMGWSGPLTTEIGNGGAGIWDYSGRGVTFDVTFWGEEGFCGGFHSPLVLYFSDARPKYMGTTSMELTQKGLATYWPEATTETYFLALDKDNSGCINSVTELFGNESGAYTNGFEALKKYDLNKDNVIDQKDKVFSSLRLWKDSSGQGKCSKKDLYSLKEKTVSSISLKYKELARPYGNRAEERQEASFQYTKNKVLKTGKIVDIWLGQAGYIVSKK